MKNSEEKRTPHRHKKRVVIGVAALITLLVATPTLFAKILTHNLRYDIDDSTLPTSPVVIVFGAGVYASGQPTPYLKNRIETAVLLQKQGKAQKILMSGDNSNEYYNEPEAMKDYAIERGVPKDDVVLDYAGLNTYDTCYRAKAIFGVSNATLVTQGYHLPRAVMTCNALGLKSIGVAAQKQERDYTLAYVVREFAATAKDLGQIIIKPEPAILGPAQPIN